MAGKKAMDKRLYKLYFGAAMALVLSAFYIISSMSGLKEYIQAYQWSVLIVIVAGYAAFYGYMLWEKRMSVPMVVAGIFLASLLIRGWLVVVLPYNMAQHDVHFFGDWNTDAMGSGHFGYIQYLMRYGKLPDFDPRQVWSFYNPPLHHILSAVWMKFNHWMGLGYEVCAENLQILTLCYSSITLYTVDRIFIEVSLKGKARVIAFGILAFHPIFAILSLSLNNDSLSVLWMTVAILYTIRWYKNQKLRYILVTALAMGLGMMAKLSVGLLAPAIAVVFLAVLVQKRADWKRLFGQFAAFGVLCVPLGLFWPIRCKEFFDMPLNYVQPLGEGDMWQYVGDYNFWQRLGAAIKPVLADPWYTGAPADQHNVWLEMFRTAILDEWGFQLPHPPYVLLAKILVVLGIALGLLATGLFIWCIVRKDTMSGAIKWMFGIGYLTFICFFIKFVFQYPYICSENFRYIVPTLLFTVTGTGIWLMKDEKHQMFSAMMQVLAVTFMLVSGILLVSYGMLLPTGQTNILNL